MKRTLVVFGLVVNLFLAAMCLAQDGTVSGKVKLASHPNGYPTGSEICRHITVSAGTYRKAPKNEVFKEPVPHTCAGPEKTTGTWTENNECEYSLSIPHGCLGKELWVSGSYSGSWSQSLGSGWVAADPQEGLLYPPTLTAQHPKAEVLLLLLGEKID